MTRYRYKEPVRIECARFGHTKDMAVCIAARYEQCQGCPQRAANLSLYQRRDFRIVETETEPRWADQYVRYDDDGTRTLVDNPQPRAVKRNSFWDGFKPSSPSTYRYTPTVKSASGQQVVVPKTKKATLGEVSTSKTLTRKYRELSKGRRK